MKHPFWNLVCILFLAGVFLPLGCEEPGTVPWKAWQVSGPACKDCPDVQVAIPKGPEDNKLAVAAHTAMREEIVHWLDYAEENRAETIEEAIAAFGSGYRGLLQRYPDESTPWEARIEGLVRFENPRILSISLDAYIFTGGAHGYQTRRYLNFDARNGTELEPYGWVSDSAAFRQLAENAFRMAHGIPVGTPINATGFMFEGNRFHLPENAGFTPEGIELYYNPYEVASFAEGPVALTIPFEKAMPYISERLRPLGIPNP